MNETLRVIRERRTTRKFKGEQIKDEELEAIVQAGLYAPSAHNQQSWNFSVIQNLELIAEMNTETKEVAKTFPNETIQKMGNNEKLDLFYGAPTVIVVSGKNDAMMPQVDCAAATENMFIAAESINIGGCWNGSIGLLFNGPKGEEYKKRLGIPEGYTPYYAAVFGYKDVKTGNAPERKVNSVQYIK